MRRSGGRAGAPAETAISVARTGNARIGPTGNGMATVVPRGNRRAGRANAAHQPATTRAAAIEAAAIEAARDGAATVPAVIATSRLRAAPPHRPVISRRCRRPRLDNPRANLRIVPLAAGPIRAAGRAAARVADGPNTATAEARAEAGPAAIAVHGATIEIVTATAAASDSALRLRPTRSATRSTPTRRSRHSASSRHSSRNGQMASRSRRVAWLTPAADVSHWARS